MDTAFVPDKVARAQFLQAIMLSFRCSYVCVWSYFTPSNCLLFLDGFYQEDQNTLLSRPSSSSGISLSRRLFNEYTQLPFSIENGLVPGLAFKNNMPFLELQEADLQTHASADVQRQFYVEARIKTSVFLASANGEIELGFSIISQPGDIATVMKKLILASTTLPDQQNPLASSSSSSLRSLSMDDSPESPSLLFNLPNTTTTNFHIPEAFRDHITAQDQDPASKSITKRSIPHVNLSSPSSASSSRNAFTIVPQNSAFKKYGPGLVTTQMRTSHSMLKRSITFLRSVNLMRIRERMQVRRPTTTQLHHMISERKRREKLNESFMGLRTLLPSGTKKDKASVLATTREYLTSLKSKVEDLSKKNQLLEAQLLPNNREIKASTSHEDFKSSSDNDRFNVRVSNVAESTSQAGRIVDLQIRVRGDQCEMVDLVIRILEFLKLVNNSTVSSMDANTQITESSYVHQLTLRLVIQEEEWDESAFQEAVRRVVADMTPF